MATIDAAFFAHYDAVSAEAAALAHADASLASTTNQLGAVRLAERDAEAARLRNQREQERRRRKIERCQNHWFYSNTALQPSLWCRGGVEGRIQRQQAKLALDEQALPSLAAKEQGLESHIGALQNQQAELQGMVARLRSLEAERENMFESAVSGAATSQLHSLNSSAAQWSEALAIEQSTAAQLQHSLQGCAHARQLYMNALHAMHSAGQTNQAAQVNNIFDASEFVEHIQQDQRDRMMQESQMLAAQAATVLQSALQSVPPRARDQHPHLCPGLGQVALPQLKQTGAGTAMLEIFGGDLGDAIAGSNASRMIHENIGILGQCERLAAQQEAMVNALLQSVREAVASAGATLQQIKGSIASEKQNIFNGLRANYGMEATTAMPAAVVAQPVGADVREQRAAVVVQAAWYTKHSTYEPPVAIATAAPAAASPAPVAVATAVPA